jgi:hypothetical protein
MRAGFSGPRIMTVRLKLVPEAQHTAWIMETHPRQVMTAPGADGSVATTCPDLDEAGQ